MFDLLFNGASYGSQFFYDITWLVWAKRIVWWTVCVAGLYCLPEDLSNIYESYTYGHILSPYGLEIAYGYPTASFDQIYQLGWGVMGFVPSLVLYAYTCVYTKQLLSLLMYKPFGGVHALDSTGVHWINRPDFERIMDKISYHQHTNLDPSLLSTSDLLSRNYDFDTVILSDYALYLEMLLA